MDTETFFALYSLTGHYRLFDQFIGIFSNVALFALLCWALFIIFQRRDIFSGILLCLSMVGAYVINMGIGALYFRARPFVALHIQPVAYAITSDKSFPSDHTALSFVIATMIFLHAKKSGIYAFVLAGLIGISRVIGGVHYPTDIMGGAVVGISVVYIFRFVMKKV